MSEYPKRCTMEEAIAVVKAGGKADLKGTAEVVWTKIRRTTAGKVFVRWFPGEHREYYRTFDKRWHYQITKPAPSATRTYTTAEAVAEVLRSGEEMVGLRDGSGSEFTLKLDSDGDIKCCDCSGFAFPYIPGDAAWAKKSQANSKPPPIVRDVTIDTNTELSGALEGHICAIRASWPGKVRVQWTVEAVD